MLNTLSLIQIQTQFGIYIGKILHQDTNRIKLGSVCILKLKKIGADRPPQIDLLQLGHDIVFYGAMIALEVQEDDPIAIKYYKVTSNIEIFKTIQ